jgi:hypothetical protein
MIMTGTEITTNKIIGNYKAQVNGSITALAGCTSTVCERDCLRKAPELAYRENLKPENNDRCGVFITR